MIGKGRIMNANNTPMPIGDKAKGQLQELLDGVQHANASLAAYVRGLATGMNAPDGWMIDPRTMAFIPPPAAPEPELQKEGAADA